MFVLRYTEQNRRKIYIEFNCRSLKVNVQDYEKFIGELAKARKMEVADIKDKMSECGAPGHTGSSVS